MGILTRRACLTTLSRPGARELNGARFIPHRTKPLKRAMLRTIALADESAPTYDSDSNNQVRLTNKGTAVSFFLQTKNRDFTSGILNQM